MQNEYSIARNYAIRENLRQYGAENLISLIYEVIYDGLSLRYQTNFNLWLTKVGIPRARTLHVVQKCL